MSLKERFKIILTTKELPQANTLEHLMTTIYAVANGASTYQDIAKAIRLDNRQGRYYRHASEFLGMVQTFPRNKSEITVKGNILLSLSEPSQKVFLADAVLKTRVFSIIFKFIKLNPGCTKDDIISELLSFGLKSSKVVVRRTSTMMKWLKELELIDDEEEKYSAIWEPAYEGNVVKVLEKTNNYKTIHTTKDAAYFPTLKQIGEIWDGSNKESNDGSNTYYIDVAARERANKVHQKLVSIMARRLTESNIVPKMNKFIDLFAMTNLGEEHIFEMKSCSQENIKTQIRRGMSQLYEYRYRQQKLDSTLWLVLEVPPQEANSWYIDFLVSDRGINVCWLNQNNDFECPGKSNDALKRLFSSN